MARNPAFLFYPGDWLKNPALRRLSFAARGFYVDLLCLAFECDEPGTFISENIVWSDDDILSCVVGEKASNRIMFDDLLRSGLVARNSLGATICPKIIEAVRLSRTRSKAGKKGGSKHASKMSSKRQAKRRAKSKQNPVTVTVTETEDDFSFEIPSALDTPIAREAMRDWLNYKKKRGEAYKDLAFFARKLIELEPLGADGFVAAVNSSIGNNYHGIFPAKEAQNAQQRIGPGQVFRE